MKSACLLPLLALATPPPAATAPAPPDPASNLVGLVTADDYPLEALQLGQQGTVNMRMHVGTDGQVKRCEIVQSSQSESLDATSCGIMIDRARFAPARDANGRAVEGTYEQRLTWRIMDGPQDLAMNEATSRWMTCVVNQAEPEFATGRSAEAIAEAAYVTCAPLEAGLRTAIASSTLENVDFEMMLRSLKEQSLFHIRELLKQARAGDEATMDQIG